MIDFTLYVPYIHMAIVALLPFLVALVAGAIRQDGLPDSVNEVISYIVVLSVAFLQAVADGKLGGTPLADFMIVAGYSQAALHSPLLQSLQGYLQGNVLAFLKSAPAPVGVPAASDSTPPASVDVNAVAQTVFDLLKKNGPLLAAIIGGELAKQMKMGAAPAPAVSGYTGGSNLGLPVHVDELNTKVGIPVAVAPVQPVRTNKAG